MATSVTKAMYRHLEDCGCTFVQNEHTWSCFLDGEEVDYCGQLGALIWRVARKLGED